MTDDEEDITSLKCHFVDVSNVKTIREESPKICEVNPDNQKCFTQTHDDSEYCSSVSGKLSVFKQKLIKILKGDEADLNDIFSEGNIEDTDKMCICLKQWFYKKVINVVEKQTLVHKTFNTCNGDIKNKINVVSSHLCTFRNLNFQEMKNIKLIYDFYLFYYTKIRDFTTAQKTEEQQELFKEGFYEHCNGIIECLNSTSSGEYCEEFKEYHNKYNALKIFLESLISYKDRVHGSDCTNGCVLSMSLLNGQYRLKLIEEIETIRSRYRSTNFSTIATTVVFLVIGIVMGITPRKFWIHIRKLKNKEVHTNVDDESESNSLVTSENLESSSKRKGYSISYKSVKYS
ncbi:PIR Superfamily Protein [Plasmodium ovale curtisi]|uniref:PIR Superfamily Protein n=1 Tax=Plasmodium ovale curtisi TaxID=864141 RepID=A0A1A8X9Y3_PLAOA|nr:PIR Superfamily Protein [Plasmodium ovale curtisi]